MRLEADPPASYVGIKKAPELGSCQGLPNNQIRGYYVSLFFIYFFFFYLRLEAISNPSYNRFFGSRKNNSLPLRSIV